MMDLSGKLHTCLKQALCDYILELYFLPQPIALIYDTDYYSPLLKSPFIILESPPTDFARQDSKEDNLDSPQRTLFEKGEVRVPSSLGFSSLRSVDSILSPDTPVQSEPHRSRCDTTSITNAMDDVLRSLDASNSRNDGTTDKEPTESSGLTWQMKEKNRREMEAINAYQKEAYHGRQGVLENTYSSLIPKHFMEVTKLHSRSLSHYAFPLLGSYSAEVFLNETLSFCGQLCPDLTLSTFKLDTNGEYSHYTPQKTSRLRVVYEVAETEVIVVGRNLKQWDEARSPTVLEIRLTQVSLVYCSFEKHILHSLGSRPSPLCTFELKRAQRGRPGTKASIYTCTIIVFPIECRPQCSYPAVDRCTDEAVPAAFPSTGL